MAILRTILGVIVFLGAWQSHAQTTFAKLYTATGYDYGRGVIESFQDSGLVVTGSSSSFTTETADVLLLKTDSIGNFEWSQAYGSSGSDWGHKIIQTQDTGYVIAGYTNSYGAGGFDFYVLKTDQYGQMLWDTTFGGADWDIAHSLVELPNKDIVIVGETQSFGNGNKDGYIVCVDSAGGFKWEKTYGGTGDEVIKDIVYYSDTLFMVGMHSSHNNDLNGDGWIINFNTNSLDTNYTLKMGGVNDDIINAIDVRYPRLYFAGEQYSQSFSDDSWRMIYDLDNGTFIDNVVTSGGSYALSDSYNDVAVSSTFSTPFYVGSTASSGYGLIDAKSDFLFNATNYGGVYLPYISTFGEEGSDIGHGATETYIPEYVVYVGDYKNNSTGGNGLILIRIGLNDDQILPSDITNMQITTSINNSQLNKFKSIGVYPNPAKEQLNVNSKVNINSYTIYGISGVLIKTNSNVNLNDFTININDLKPGSYILDIKSNDSNKKIKFIVN